MPDAASLMRTSPSLGGSSSMGSTLHASRSHRTAASVCTVPPRIVVRRLMHATGRRLGAAAVPPGSPIGTLKRHCGHPPNGGSGAGWGDDPIGRDRPRWHAVAGGRRGVRDNEGGDPGAGAPRRSRSSLQPHAGPGRLRTTYDRPTWTSRPCCSTVLSVGTREARPTFHQCVFDPADALAVLDVFERHGVTPGANFETQEWDVVSGPVPSSGEPYVVWAGSHLRLVDDLRSMVAALPVYAFSVVACPEEAVLRAVRDELAAAGGVGMVNVFPDKVFGGWTLDSAPKGVNKWSGVEAYCRYRDSRPCCRAGHRRRRQRRGAVRTRRPCMRHEPCN